MEAIEHWWLSAENAELNRTALHALLVREHGYDGGLRSVQRYSKNTYPAPRVWARRRVESSPRITATGPRPLVDAGRPGAGGLGVRSRRAPTGGALAAHSPA
ncbi:MAG: hypothetical protein AAF416_11665 [Pseudomonadota bacterium]